MNTTPSVNALAAPLAASLCADAATLRLKVSRDGPTVVDAGIACVGGIEAGRRIAEICLGGLGRVRVGAGGGGWPLALTVTSSQPMLACRFDLATGGTLDRGKIVRLNPALSQGENPTRRIQLIVVNVFANDQSLWDELAQALREVDYPALRRLLR